MGTKGTWRRAAQISREEEDARWAALGFGPRRRDPEPKVNIEDFGFHVGPGPYLHSGKKVGCPVCIGLEQIPEVAESDPIK